LQRVIRAWDGARAGGVTAHAHETEILQERLTALSVEVERLRLSAAFAPLPHAHLAATRVEAAGEARAHATFEASVRASGVLAGRPRAGEGRMVAAAGGHAVAVSEAVPAPQAARHDSRAEQRGADVAGGADGGWGVVEAVDQPEAADQPRSHAPLPVPLDAGTRHQPPAHAGAPPSACGPGSLSLLAIKQVRPAHWLAVSASRCSDPLRVACSRPCPSPPVFFLSCLLVPNKPSHRRDIRLT